MNHTSLKPLFQRTVTTLLTALPVIIGGYSATTQATDIEVFFTSPVTTTGVAPNVIFLLDASTSMWTPAPVPADPFDPATPYTAPGCDTSAYYYVIGSGTPGCASPKVSSANFYCTATKGLVDASGRYTFPVKVAEQHNVTTGNKKNQGTRWRTAQGTANTPIICQGDGTPPATTFPLDWTPITSNGVTFYSGNYLAWQASVGASAKPRIEVMKESVLELARNTSGINISLMRFGANNNLATNVDAVTGECLPDRGTPEGDEGSGQSGEGLVVMEMSNINLAGTLMTIEEKLFNEMVPGQGSACPVQLFTPNGRTGMATALYEAYAYYRGDAVSSKNNNLTAGISSQHDYPSVAGSRVGNVLTSSRYKSPIIDGCAKNYIVMLTDGTTEQDRSSDNDIVKLREPLGTGQRTFANIVGSCDDNPELDEIKPQPSSCVDDMAEFMFKADASGSIAGIQNIKTYTIGFALDVTATQNAEPLLRKTAVRGGGKYYRADDAKSLEEAFEDIVRAVLTDNATFTAPAVTVDAFNRTRNLDDIYVSLFRPDLTYRWFGNVKKFRVDDKGDIVDVNGAPAVDPADGFLLSTSQSDWSASVDGKDIALGGAVENLPNWNARRIYTNLTANSNLTFSGTNTANQLTALQDGALYTEAVASARLGIQATDTVLASDLVDWMYGRDIDDVNADGSTADTRRDMGDPLHSRPVVLVYGGTAADPDVNDSRLFVTTNDGFLHSIDTVDGQEQWAFIPQTLLARARDLYVNEETSPEDREYGLDANIRLLIFDNNGNGIIEPSEVDGQRDRAYLFFGMRRGGVAYFGLDVSVKDSPKLMWFNNSLPGAGQSWSTPQPARVKVGTEEKVVLIMSGGYDIAHEDATGSPSAPAWEQYPDPNDVSGNRIYMLDAYTGQLLWNAGLTGATSVNLGLAEMKHAFAADVRVLDLSGDGFADRMYAADLGGRVWRFDIFNGKSATSTTAGDRLVEGGVFANLGNAGDSPADSTATRRFFYAPDVVPFELFGRSVVNVGIGSGHRELPATDTNTRNAFFSMRDLNRYTPLLSNQYKASCVGDTGPCHQIITESDDDLVDLTDIVGEDATELVPIGSRGWKIWLSRQFGEKVLSEARTLGGTTFFTTYEPTPREYIPSACAVNFGTNRLYTVNIVDGRPVYPRDTEFNTDTDGDGINDSFEERVADRSSPLTQSGIASEVVFLFTDQLVPGTTTGERRVFCLAGFTRCPPGLSVEPVRTYWRQRGAQ